jgi:hypothetical protein
MTCPNINLTEWKNLVNIRGENIAYYLWDFYKGEVPEHEYLQINTVPYIKSGVSELFESNPELANAVYEALEFKTNSLQAFKDNLINIIGVDKVKELYAGTDVEFNSFTIDDVELGTDKSLIVTIKTDKGQRTAINLRLDGDYQYLKISEGNKTVKGIYAPLSEKKTAIDFLINEFKNLNIQEATPQQKQQAQQLYSQYLDTIFLDSKVKDIVYHGTKDDIEGFRNFVNLNNSNYIESNDDLIKKYALSGLSAEEIGDILKKNC